MQDLNEVLLKLIGNYMIELYGNQSNDKSTSSSTGRIIPTPNTKRTLNSHASTADVQNNDICIIDKTSSVISLVAPRVPQPTNRRDLILEYLYRDLFLWSILTYRIELSKLFLSKIKTRICTALVGSKILRSLSVMVHEQETRMDLEEQASSFESIAIECLKCCYNEDKEYAYELVIRKIDLYGGITCLQVCI